MKLKLLLRSAIAACIVVLAGSAHAITITNDSLVGGWTPGSTLNNDPDATLGANALIAWYNGGAQPNAATLNVKDNKNHPLTFTLSGEDFGVLPGPLTFGAKEDNGTPKGYDPAVVSYLLGKYGNATYLFYIGNLTEEAKLPTSFGGNGLSHQIAFAAPRQSVPDGGASLLLMSMAITGLGVMRRCIVVG